MTAFSRILLKLSGEALMGSLEYGTDPERVQAVAAAIKRVHDRDVQVAVERERARACVGERLAERVLAAPI